MTISRRTAGGLLAILIVALWLRLDGLAFGLPALYDPDEPIFVLIALKMLRGHTLDPGWFGHPGTTTIYVLALIDIAVYALGAATGRFADPSALARAIYTDPGVVFLPGRAFILLCGLAVVLLTWWLGRRLFGERVGLIAALLLAVDPVHVRYSQIIRTDMHATIFIMLALVAAVTIIRTGGVRGYVLAGVWLGLGCATKWPSAAAGIAVAGAALWHARHGQPAAALLGLALSGACTIAALFVASPYLFLDFATVRADLRAEARPIHIGATGHGFFGDLLWYVDTPLLTAFGIAGLALAALGLWVGTRRSPGFAVAVVPAFVAFLAMICAQKLIWERWAVPLLPLISIAAAVGIEALARWAGGWRTGGARLGARGRRWLEPGVAALLCGSVLGPTFVTARSQAAERRDDTRAHASAWAAAHFAPGSTVALEHLAFDTLVHPWPIRYAAGDIGCIDGRAYLKGQIPYSTVDGWRGGRSVIDLGSIAPDKLGTCRADWAILVNYDRYLAEPGLFPDEVAGYRRLLAHGRIVATFRPVPGVTGGPIVRIVQFAPGWSAGG